MTKLFNINTDSNTDIESHAHAQARTISVIFLEPRTRSRHNRREDGKRESPHCDTNTTVPWKTSQQHSVSNSMGCAPMKMCLKRKGRSGVIKKIRPL